MLTGTLRAVCSVSHLCSATQRLCGKPAEHVILSDAQRDLPARTKHPQHCRALSNNHLDLSNSRRHRPAALLQHRAGGQMIPTRGRFVYLCPVTGFSGNPNYHPLASLCLPSQLIPLPRSEHDVHRAARGTTCVQEVKDGSFGKKKVVFDKAGCYAPVSKPEKHQGIFKTLKTTKDDDIRVPQAEQRWTPVKASRA